MPINPASLKNLTGGSRKGIPNKSTLVVKKAISFVYEGLGGDKAMLEWAKKNEGNQTVFYSSILPKLIPHEIQIDTTEEFRQFFSGMRAISGEGD